MLEEALLSICVSVGGGVGSGKWLREEVAVAGPATTDDLT